MSHTEEEAKELWCPIVHRQEDGQMMECVASDCMMWRWIDDEFEYLFSPPEQEGWKHVPYCSESGRVVDRWGRSHQNRKGYCGLGGKP